MSVNRTYPRNDSEYPEIMSKLDPLIIRVSSLVLVVGTTSYTAKVKMGIRFSGYTVHASGVGLPIYQEEVDISQYSTNTTTTGEGSDAWNYIHDLARDWMDQLEISILQNSNEKNIVDLLREIKFQMHFDLSGHKQDPSPYGPTFEYCTTQPTYLETLVQDMETLNGSIDGTTVQPTKSGLNQKMDTLTGRIDSDPSSSYGQGLNQRVTDVYTQLGTLTGRMDSDSPSSYGDGLNQRITDLNENTQESLQQLHTDLVGTGSSVNIASKLDDIVTAITNGYQTIADAIDNQTSRITELITDVEALAGVVDLIHTSVGDAPATPEQAEGQPSLQGFIRQIVSYNIKQLLTRVGQSGGSMGIYPIIETIRDTTNTIHNTDVPDIKSAISSSSSSGAVSDLAGVVSSMNDTVNGISGTVYGINNTTVDTFNTLATLGITDINTVSEWLCRDDAVITLHDALAHIPDTDAYIDAKILS